MKNNWKVLSANIIIVFVFVLSSCGGGKFKSSYSGEVSDKKGNVLKGVTIYAISNGKADSNLIHALSPEEIALFKGEKDISSSFGDKTDTSGKFAISVELETASPTPSMYLLFKKAGYKSVLLNMEAGTHTNTEVKLDSLSFTGR
jgi:hypothetical protein